MILYDFVWVDLKSMVLIEAKRLLIWFYFYLNGNFLLKCNSLNLISSCYLSIYYSKSQRDGMLIGMDVSPSAKRYKPKQNPTKST